MAERRTDAREDEVAADVAAALRDAGLRGALAALNRRTRYRFTGLYRVDPPLLHNVCLYDRENPSLSLGGESTTLDETYCALAAAAPFATLDGRADRRVASHSAASGPVRSYLGVPIRCGGGRITGTLCHFDHRPRLIPRDEVRVLERAGALLGVILAWPSPRGSPER